MAIARKPSAKVSPAKPAKSASAADIIEPAVTAAFDQDSVMPALEETLDATLNQAENLQEQLRLATEKSVEQSKLIYERLKAAADDTSSSLEASLTSASKGVSEINMKTIDALKANADAQFAFIKALFATKSISEAIALQGEHARVQFEIINAQAKDMTALIQQVSTDTMEPIKTSLTRSLQIAA